MAERRTDRTSGPLPKGMGGKNARRTPPETPKDVVRKYDVPYLAGSSNDGSKVYIDRRLPRHLRINDKVIDPAETLSTHERYEHRLMRRGMAYKPAHKEATRAEKAHVKSLGVNWAEYEHVLDGYINETEHEKARKLPPDLYMKPYPHKRHM